MNLKLFKDEVCRNNISNLNLIEKFYQKKKLNKNLRFDFLNSINPNFFNKF